MPASTPRLADFWLPTLELARRLFREPPADIAGVGPTLIASLDTASARAADHGFAQTQIQSARFAVVAWLDETAMTQPWPGASGWRLAPLQRHDFSTTRAGVEFFQRLDALGEDDAAVREVYALMLVAGFAGHYSARPPGELAALRHDVVERVTREGNMARLAVDEPLFPAASAMAEARAERRTPRPATATLMLIAVPLCLLVGLYVYLDATLAQLASQLMQRI